MTEETGADKDIANSGQQSSDRLRKELEEAKAMGRWKGDEERRDEELEAKTIAEAKKEADILEAKKGCATAFLAIAWFIPVLWPYAIVTSLALFPKTTKKIGIGLAVAVATAITAWMISSLSSSQTERTAQSQSDQAPLYPSSTKPLSEPVEPISPAKTSKSTEEGDGTPAPSSSGRRYLGSSATGYELWADNDCVYVVGITEGDLSRLGTDVWGFKQAVKQETGYKCVIYE